MNLNLVRKSFGADSDSISEQRLSIQLTNLDIDFWTDNDDNGFSQILREVNNIFLFVVWIFSSINLLSSTFTERSPCLYRRRRGLISLPRHDSQEEKPLRHRSGPNKWCNRNRNRRSFTSGRISSGWEVAASLHCAQLGDRALPRIQHFLKCHFYFEQIFQICSN